MIPRERTFEKISRPAYKLDTLIKNRRCPSPHVVKMDTEGAEMAIVKGMVETIKKKNALPLFSKQTKTWSGLDTQRTISSIC